MDIDKHQPANRNQCNAMQSCCVGSGTDSLTIRKCGVTTGVSDVGHRERHFTAIWSPLYRHHAHRHSERSHHTLDRRHTTDQHTATFTSSFMGNRVRLGAAARRAASCPGQERGSWCGPSRLYGSKGDRISSMTTPAPRLLRDGGGPLGTGGRPRSGESESHTPAVFTAPGPFEVATRPPPVLPSASGFVVELVFFLLLLFFLRLDGPSAALGAVPVFCSRLHN